jgi:hypothetical protein
MNETAADQYRAAGIWLAWPMTPLARAAGFIMWMIADLRRPWLRPEDDNGLGGWEDGAE